VALYDGGGIFGKKGSGTSTKKTGSSTSPFHKDGRSYSPFVSKPASTSAPQPIAPPPPPPSYTAPSIYGPAGGGGGAMAPATAPAPPPPPMTDVDWFNKDSVFRNQATLASNDLVSQLAELLFQRGQGFQAIDGMRRDWTEARDDDVEMTGEDFAARGLGASGLYKRGYDDLISDYERRKSDIDTGEQDLVQQFGQRGSLAGGIDRSGLIGGNYDALASIYGQLGRRGTQLGDAYSGRLQGLRAESAGRANQDIIKTLGW
jgi:hypothetical protein